MARCNCIRTATSAENRAYDATVRRIRKSQGRAAARAWIEEQHRLFRQTKARCPHRGWFW